MGINYITNDLFTRNTHYVLDYYPSSIVESGRTVQSLNEIIVPSSRLNSNGLMVMLINAGLAAG